MATNTEGAKLTLNKRQTVEVRERLEAIFVEAQYLTVM